MERKIQYIDIGNHDTHWNASNCDYNVVSDGMSIFDDIQEAWLVTAKTGSKETRTKFYQCIYEGKVMVEIPASMCIVHYIEVKEKGDE